MRHCCSAMTKALEHHCAEHENRFECPDALISYYDKFDEYGLIIHDGGTAVSSIDYCPYCDKKLPESKRDLWFDTLESMGYDDPTEQEIPSEFQSGDWYRGKKL
ncbi:DUF6980 family protein [Vreelandella titanicae]|uniref:DUF6980 family protein n=1 Tax=Vreelandella titanicae TaxID=664683 RepID=UPI003CC91EFA